MNEPKAIATFIAAAGDAVKSCARAANGLPWSTMTTSRVSGIPAHALAVRQARVKLALDITASMEHGGFLGLFRSSQRDTVARVRAETSLRPAAFAEGGIGPGRVRRVIVLPHYLRLDMTPEQRRQVSGASADTSLAIVLDLGGAGLLGISRDSEGHFCFRWSSVAGMSHSDATVDDDDTWFPISLLIALLGALRKGGYDGWQFELGDPPAESPHDGVTAMQSIGWFIESMGLNVARELYDELAEPVTVAPADLSGYLVGDLRASLEFALDEEGKISTLTENEDRISFGTELRLARNGPEEILACYTVGAPDLLAAGRVFDAFVDALQRWVDADRARDTNAAGRLLRDRANYVAIMRYKRGANGQDHDLVVLATAAAGSPAYVFLPARFSLEGGSENPSVTVHKVEDLREVDNERGMVLLPSGVLLYLGRFAAVLDAWTRARR